MSSNFYLERIQYQAYVQHKEKKGCDKRNETYYEEKLHQELRMDIEDIRGKQYQHNDTGKKDACGDERDRDLKKSATLVEDLDLLPQHHFFLTGRLFEIMTKKPDSVNRSGQAVRHGQKQKPKS